MALRRLRFLDPLLRSYLETEGHRSLTTGLFAELEIERGVEPAGAFARIVSGDVLFYTLPGFIEPGVLSPTYSRTESCERSRCTTCPSAPIRTRGTSEGTRPS
ncbi:hypothetical protein BHD05_09560 [Marisediminicola antarctica]|uniref:Uncharacterized protein n=1 Tax=Marisediminicola antarctica TaxID=674079 RepID=A0A7L5AL43_9MICO|nr:hypothetical protein BHD05_09560 [Marisediminicola antarctica]